MEQSTAVNEAGWDNMGTSALTIQQILTTTGWDFIMYRAMDTASPFAVIYFLMVLLIGTYLLMNLIVAVRGLQERVALSEACFPLILFSSDWQIQQGMFPC